MGIRIERVKIDRGGPLKEDFDLKTADLNVIYGDNETGKTYLVEAMIRFLFTVGKDTPWNFKWSGQAEPNLRNWNPGGNIVVSGLEEGEITFTQAGRKFEDYSNIKSSLPPDFSRLMVVRAGDSRLSVSRDGVGRDVLKTYLSGEGILDDVDKNISATTMEACIKDGIIEGPSRGIIKQRDEAADEMRKLDELRGVIDDNASHGSLSALEKEQRKLKQNIQELDRAKRYYAFKTDEDLQKLALERESQPSDTDLSKLEAEINLFRERKLSRKRQERKLDGFRKSEEDYRWTGNAVDIYRGITERQSEQPKGNFMLMVLILVSISLTVAGGFLSKPVMVVFALTAAFLLVLRILRDPKAVPIASQEELEKLEKEFRRRFNTELTDLAALRSTNEKLSAKHIRAESLRETLTELEREIESTEQQILMHFNKITGKSIPEDMWVSTILKIKDEKKALDETTRERENTLSRLNILQYDYLETEPKVEWDAEVLKKKQVELTTVEENLGVEKASLGSLKIRLAMETSGSTEDSWEELLTALENKREATADGYRSLTAEILAKIKVHKAVEEYRKEENVRITTALESDELTKPLREWTGHYSGANLTSTGDLNITTDSGDEFPLEILSTGAREQVYLAIRMGSARIAMQQPAFLILDDAFQLSDWERRDSLVNHTIEMVKNGWQIFYLTMDYHILGLYDSHGKEQLKSRYKSVSLK